MTRPYMCVLIITFYYYCTFILRADGGFILRHRRLPFRRLLVIKKDRRRIEDILLAERYLLKIR